MRSFLLALGILPSAFLAGCSSSLSSVVDEHREATGHDYIQCGTIQRNNECPSELSPPEKCLLDAFASCQAAEAAVDQVTVEGDPIPEHWFVDPQSDGSCVVTRFTDSSEDEFKGDYPDLQEFACIDLHVSDAAEGCVLMFPGGCEDVTDD